MLLDAGADILLERGLPGGLNIKIADACRRIGRTSGSAYQVWPSQADYQRDLAIHVARSVDYAGAETLESAVSKALALHDNELDMVREIGTSYFRNLVGNEFFYLSMAFWAERLDTEDDIALAIRAGYDEIQTQFEGFFGAFLDTFGRSLRTPWTIRAMTMASTGITEGLALRHRVAVGEAEKAEIVRLYGDLIVSLTEQMAPRS